MIASSARDATLYNADLAPIPPEKRNWTTYSYASLWVSMSVCIPTYMLASGLIGMIIALCLAVAEPLVDHTYQCALVNGAVIGPGSLTGPVYRTAQGLPIGHGAAVNGPPP